MIGADGSQLGIMTSSDALALAEEKDLDLVKIAPNAVPPVCKIMDYGKFRFEQLKKEKEAKKNQKVVEIKEIRMSPSIDTNDFNTKVKSAVKFLNDGNRVKVTVRFRGREMAHTSLGQELLAKFGADCSEIATIAKDYTDSLYRTLGHVTLISDRDAVVAVSGAGKRDQFEKALSAETENIMQGRTAVMKNLSDGERMLPLVQGDQTEQYTGQIIAPILADGEIVGCLMLAERESGVRMTAVDMKVAETTAVIIGRQMEQ